ncbi:Glycosyl transferase family 2 [Parasporobacterium paucivorans DSM 15970]|uniref:Glycosyl transferase family 2 n=2 Tax=Parasporobacterium TaxID=115543 RepID=A0A1M6JV46_9FIRM|nr:Glycosyl transferase family 2 [Parasporobacterium paucivorans DSM 15970]
MNKLVSVLMPNYNCERHIAKAIESVLNQSYTNLQIIIVDDGSTDSSREIINGYLDERIEKVYLEKNSQICIALNTGIGFAKGEYLARIDSDDIWEPEKIEKQIRYLENNPDCGACFSWVSIIDENDVEVTDFTRGAYTHVNENLLNVRNKSQNGWIKELFFRENSLCHPSVIIPMKVVKEVGLYNYAMVQLQDYEYWTRIVKKHPIYVYEEKLVKYRRDSDPEKNLSGSNIPRSIRMFNEIRSIKCDFLGDMSDEKFIEVFGTFFRNKLSQKKEELDIEKAMLTRDAFKIHGLDLPLANRLEEYINEDNMRIILEKEYDFTVKDFYELNTLHNFYDPVAKEFEKQYRVYKEYHDNYNSNMEYLSGQSSLYKERHEQLQIEHEQLRTEYEQLQHEKDGLDQKYNDLRNSISWRITKPIRKLRQSFRKK